MVKKFRFIQDSGVSGLLTFGIAGCNCAYGIFIYQVSTKKVGGLFLGSGYSEIMRESSTGNVGVV